MIYKEWIYNLSFALNEIDSVRKSVHDVPVRLS